MTLLLLFAITLAQVARAQPAPSSVLTLEKSVHIALTNATRVLQQQNQVALSATEVLQGYGQFLPNLVAGGSYGYHTGTTLYTIQGRTLVDERGQDASISLSSTLNLFNGLADYSALRSALARRDASERTLSWAKQQVALDITQTYLQLMLDQQLLDIAKKNLAASQARLRLIQGQADVGSASIPDLYRQQAETSADSFAIASTESRVNDDEALLLRKLRLDATKSYFFESPDLEPKKSELASRPIDELMDEAVKQRPDVAANQSLFEATDWDVTGAKSGYLPRIDLIFAREAAGSLLSRQLVNGVDTLTYSQQGLGAQIGNQVEYSVGLNLSWNIFDRFVTKLNVDRARTARDNTQINLDDSKFEVQADIRTAYTDYGAASRQLEAARTGLQSAERSYQATEGAYRVGSASIVDVLTAQAALVQARSNQAQALTNLRLQKTTLEYAAGKLADTGAGE